MPKEKTQRSNICDEYPVEIRTALAASADKYDSSNNNKKLARKEAKSH
ncbi:MAG: hypothetical protein ACOX47_08020 [Bacillota bacterium]|jgi:hypothetical protein